jgi:hypothetical protein
MILNAYAVLDVFVTLLRLVFAFLIVGVGISAWWRRESLVGVEGRTSKEDRTYLLFLLTLVLLGLNVVSWPLLYLLLESYVPEWPGVMCIYGVTQIGAGTAGISRFLPGLLTTLQVTKPALVFASGTWFVLYLANRRTRTAPLMNRILSVLIAVGLLAATDSLVEGAYLLIPKKEEWLSTGCCTAVFDQDAHEAEAEPVLGVRDRPWLFAAFYGINIGMVLALAEYTRRWRLHQRTPGPAPLLAGALVALPISGLFLKEIAAPVLLHLPYHHCPYDLIPKIPEATVAIALFILGSLSIGWACAASWWARCQETQSFLEDQVGRILLMGMWAYVGSLVMMSIELAVA